MYFQLSPAQKRMWLLSQVDSRSVSYNNCVTYEINQYIDVDVLMSSLETVLERHQIIKSKYYVKNESIVQSYCPEVDSNIAYLDLGNDERRIKEEIDKSANKCFDLEEGILHEIKLIKKDNDRHILVLCLHHIISDGRSFQIFIEELCAAYAQKELTPLSVQYHEYVDWINANLQSPELLVQQEFWLNEFENGSIENLKLPVDFERNEVKTYSGDRVFFDIAGLSKLKVIAFKSRTTISTVILSCVGILLHRLSQQSKIVVGTVSEGRDNPFNKLIGMYVNTLPIKMDFDSQNSIADLLKAVTKTFFKAYEFQDYPFENLVELLNIKKDTSRNPLFDVLYVHQVFEQKFETEQITLGIVPYEKKTSQFDLLLETFEINNELRASIEYDDTLFTRATVETFAANLCEVMAALIQDISTEIGKIPISPRGNAANTLFGAEKSRIQLQSGEYHLLPYQTQFFESLFHDLNYFNRSFLIDLDASVKVADLERAFTTVLRDHEVLRSKFNRKEEGWVGTYEPFTEDYWASIFVQIDLDEIEETEHIECIEYLCNQAQESLDISNGILTKVLIFEGEKGSKLFFVAHKMVFDEHSWTLLVLKINKLLNFSGNEVEPLVADHERLYKTIVDSVYSGGASGHLHKEYWINSLNNIWINNLPFDNKEFDFNDDTNQNTSYISREWPVEFTQNILKLKDTHNIDAPALLLAAFFMAMESATGSSQMRVMYKHNMRNDFQDSTHLIGCFESNFPITLISNPKSNFLDLIKDISQQYKKAKGNGLSYGLLHHVYNDPEIKTLSEHANAWFNFSFNHKVDDYGLIGEQTVFTSYGLENKGNDKNPLARRDYFLGFAGSIEQGKLRFVVDYNPYQYHESTVDKIFHAFGESLEMLLGKCLERNLRINTPADYPLIKLSQYDIDLLDAKQDLEDIHVATYTQEEMLLHSSRESGCYVNQLSFSITGDLDVEALKQSWQLLIDETPALRSCFNSEFDHMLQVVKTNVDLDWEFCDWSGQVENDLFAYMRGIRAKGFDAAKPSLMSIKLIKTSQDQHMLVWSHHHAIVDRESYAKVCGRWMYFYKNLSVGAPVFLSINALKDKNESVRDQEIDILRNFWNTQLESLETASMLPSEMQVDKLTNHNDYGEATIDISKSLDANIRNLATELNVEVSTIIKGVWAFVLYHYAQEKVVAFGNMTSDWDDAKEIGTLNNVLPSIVDFGDAKISVSQFLKKLQDSELERSRHNQLELSEIRKESAISGGELFETLLVFDKHPVQNVFDVVTGLSIHVGAYEGETHYKLSLKATQGTALRLSLGYHTDKLSSDTVNQIASHVKNVVEQFALNSSTSLDVIDLMDDTERQKIITTSLGERKEYPLEECIHEVFDRQANNTPDAIAVEFNNETITYLELNQRANQLAHYLLEIGVRPDMVVGISMNRSIEMIVTLMAILKSGGAYLPLDPSYPVTRLEHMMETSKVSVILTESAIDWSLDQPSVRRIFLDDREVKAQIGKYQTSNISKATLGLHAKNLAYIIYTSGSTGKPKGVMIEHFSVIQLLYWAKDTFSQDELSKVLFCTSLNFDLSKYEMFLPLSIGATILLVNKHFDLIENSVSYRPTLINTVPSVISTLLDAGKVPESTITINLAGEPLKKELVNRIFNETKVEKVYNLYGPSEDTTYSSYVCFTRPISGDPSIGRPISNTNFYILGSDLKLLPKGVPGELYIGGAGLSRGYHNRVDLTGERFVLNAALKNEILYKTGDKVRWLPNGEVEFLGRIDHQVKIRGFRIELGEIESLIYESKQVSKAAVIAQEDHLGAKSLVAYIEFVDGLDEVVNMESIKTYLSSKLPEYMVPNTFVALKQMPLTSSGKIDRTSLMKLNVEYNVASNTQEIVLPRNSIEKTIWNIWKEVLKTDQISVFHSFAELGGNSLNVIRVLSLLRDQGLEISSKNLYASKTISEIAQKIDQGSGVVQATPSKYVQGNGYLLPFHFLYFNNVKEKAWNLSNVYFFEERLDEKVLKKVFVELLAYHDALRINFQGTFVEGSNLRNIRMVTKDVREMQPDFEVNDWKGLSKNDFDESVAKDIEFLNAGTTYGSPSLVKFRLYRGADGDHLMVLISHLICDDISFKLLKEDLLDMYFCMKRGQEHKVLRKTDSFIKASKEVYDFANSAAIEQEAVAWSDVFATFRNNAKIPKDFELAQSDRLLKNNVVLKATCISETELSAMENFCAQNSVTFVDVIMTAFGKIVKQLFGLEKIGVMLIGSGRQFDFSNLDVSRTVGSFAIGNYVVVDSEDERLSFIESVKMDKEKRARFINGGIGSNILLTMPYYRDIDHIPPMIQNIGSILGSNVNYITINYFDQRNAEEKYPVKESKVNSMAKKYDSLPTMDIIKLEIFHSDKIELELNYNKKEFSEPKMQRILAMLLESIRSLR